MKQAVIGESQSCTGDTAFRNTVRAVELEARQMKDAMANITPFARCNAGSGVRNPRFRSLTSAPACFPRLRLLQAPQRAAAPTHLIIIYQPTQAHRPQVLDPAHSFRRGGKMSLLIVKASGLSGAVYGSLVFAQALVVLRPGCMPSPGHGAVVSLRL
ncbi:unnamed protein product [Pleuronectes platessa]|uniref:Uncharacterized protein n=1 Tax=Pleuronectes platessa TaxID=8262 RepID=A0A9N7VEB0_PLEPL|nr:unnamed protein product [Pleuronectes platessa]